MKGNFHVRFLGGRGRVTARAYPAATDGIGRGWGGLVSQKTCLLASTELIRPRFAGGKVRL